MSSEAKTPCYPLEIAGLKRDLPLCKLNDDLYIAAFVIFGDGPPHSRLCPRSTEDCAEL